MAKKKQVAAKKMVVEGFYLDPRSQLVVSSSPGGPGLLPGDNLIDSPDLQTMRDAGTECRHGRLEGDPCPSPVWQSAAPCGCWPEEEERRLRTSPAVARLRARAHHRDRKAA